MASVAQQLTLLCILLICYKVSSAATCVVTVAIAASERRAWRVVVKVRLAVDAYDWFDRATNVTTIALYSSCLTWRNVLKLAASGSGSMNLSSSTVGISDVMRNPC